jgi:hypothetical protein
MSTINTVELQSIRNGQSGPMENHDEVSTNTIAPLPETGIETDALPPTDHGKQAYLVLAASTLIQAPIWGKQYC